ncbi:hypothetical protein AB0I60_20470 [Actinosynnema sp. NPDC050436]|uniref:wHTH domain-containing protein n=1 Tax=Actinosynnema sp. NPDC050436 TaxID=3155659 RepID=UPI0033E4D728
MAVFGGGDKTHNDISGTVEGPVVQANTVNFYGPPPIVPPLPTDRWVALAVDSRAWAHVPVGRDVTNLRAGVAAVAANLAAVRDQAGQVLADDPWLDPTQADRFAKRVGWLLAQKLGPVAVLDPAEAALLALVPFLHHALWSRAAAVLCAVQPADFDLGTSVGDRADYERYLRANARLLDRALLPELPDRPNARREIGWWLFNRWVRQRAELVKPRAVAALLADVGVADAGLAEPLAADRVRELLHGLRLEPQMLCGTDRLGRSAPHDTLYAGEPDEERIRGPLLGLLLGIAHAASLPITDLSDTLAWHLGIPAPVDLDRLRDTLCTAKWTTVADGLVLDASCQHGAVIEALRDHTVRVDALVDAVRRAAEKHTTLDVLGRLPARASAEHVRAARDPDGEPEFSGWSRFSLDEQRVRELLMGEQLYRDRDLAVRELYQNALDACRYRQAREQYAHRTDGRVSAWRGRIEFTQGVDENGRAYLDCADNGVGMGEAELKGVFSRAGVRFADLAGFRDEQADWNSLDPPVEFHPNSRFGIGVLSYFMLADEITVTTCRTGRVDGRPGPTLRATISGPGHLFQIQPVDEQRTPGTTVRLYLRGAEKTSCVQVLRHVLGIAEFHTTARHGAEQEEWEPGIFTARVRQPWESDSIDAHGTLVPAVGGQVIWCEHGGALLVDGLLVHPTYRHGVLAGPTADGYFRGAVVNLTGARAPRLSVDRTKVVDDVAEVVEDLVTRGIGELHRSGTAMPTLEWFGTVGWYLPRLADLVSEHVAGTSHPPGDRRGWSVPHDASRFPQDLHLVPDPERDMVLGVTEREKLLQWTSARPADHAYLWRLLANKPNPGLRVLTEVVPELMSTRPLLQAQPTDTGLLSSLLQVGAHWYEEDGALSPHDVLRMAARTGSAPRAVALRASALGLTGPDPMRFSDDVVPDLEDLGLVSNLVSDGTLLLQEHSGTSSPGQVVNGLLKVGLDLDEVTRRLRRYGFDLRVLHDIPKHPRTDDVRLLSFYGDASVPWLPEGASLPLVHLWWMAEKIGGPVEEIGHRLAQHGITVGAVPTGPASSRLHDLVLFSTGLDGAPPWLSRTRPVDPGHVVRAAAVLNSSAEEVVRRLTEAGFRCPPRVESRPGRDDAVLLSQDLDGVQPWLPLDKPVRSHHLMRYLRLADVTREQAVARLAAFGFRVDASAVAGRSAADTVLLSQRLDGSSPWLREDEPVPLAHLVEAALKLDRTVTGVADRLRELGINCPDPATTIRAALRRVPSTGG